MHQLFARSVWHVCILATDDFRFIDYSERTASPWLATCNNKLLRPVGSLQLDLVKDWTALELQLARLRQRPTLSTQGPIRLRHAYQVTTQRGAAASQTAG